jgi:hypothetical protein
MVSEWRNREGATALTREQCLIIAKHPEQYHDDNLRVALRLLQDKEDMVKRINAVLDKRKKAK